MTYKQIRQAANLSLSEIASFLGVGTRMVRYYESGERRPGGSAQRLYDQLMAKKHPVKPVTKEGIDGR